METKINIENEDNTMSLEVKIPIKTDTQFCFYRNGHYQFYFTESELKEFGRMIEELFQVANKRDW